MGTDAMRRTDIRIDKLTGHMDLMQLYAVVGEYNGRSLRVQITNGGDIEDQTGVELHFGFRSAITQKDGVLVFSVVDVTEGLYEVFYPTEMLEAPGPVVCAIRIVDSTSISKTVNFTVRVRDSVIYDGMEVPENSLKLIDKIVIDILDQEGRISWMELNFKTLADMLTLNIPNMDVAVSTRATQASVDALPSFIDGRIGTLSSKITELDADVGETSDSGGDVNTGTTMAKLNKLLERGVVKRIASGYIASNHTGWTEKTLYSGYSVKQIRTQVTIPAVNISKSMVLVDAISNYDNTRQTAIAFLLNTTTLEIRLPGGLGGSSDPQSDYREVYYQVIELY